MALSGILQQLPKHRSLPCTCDLLLSNLHFLAAYLHQLWRKQSMESWPRGNIHDFQSPTCPKSTAVHVHQTLPTYIRPLVYGAVYICMMSADFVVPEPPWVVMCYVSIMIRFSLETAPLLFKSKVKLQVRKVSEHSVQMKEST